MLDLARTLAPWSAVASLAGLAFVSAEMAHVPPAAANSAAADEPVDRAPTTPDPALLTAVGAPQVERAGSAAESTCASGMVLVEGHYCPDVEERCLRWLDPPKSRFANYRCAEYAPSKCLSRERRAMRFCIDRDEYVAKGESLPMNHASLSDAAKICANEGKRVCRESEWNFACEGEQMRPYPYGFRRDSSACNADLVDLVNEDGKLKDLRSPPGAHPRCESPFGVRDMAGNLEEMVARDNGPLWPAMKGAYWQPSRNNCRAAQTTHDSYYNGTETGFRCCSDVD
jgi:Sulfatase-modifying factor enzyme 1